ncbi:oplophorus-luciferin 2-monooxygenase non-catalytic subunit-like [Parasteatoda tepidariorum]|uniref:oplophorus-luciferin 2-monooxygenase non-catalytic subunit-like n=1 Tax=Parasteatoda tepidariorum TaxID=114398 RepID=UPI001C71869E|nr:oplophorus-luciferin 2-monooxygenase non-catalytic subunit-like [Parasteatoda tepidariorum]
MLYLKNPLASFQLTKLATEVMGISCLILVALLGLALGDDSCPKAAELSPCTCDGEGVNCMNVKSLAELKKAFSANFKYGAARTVWVQGTPLTSLTADVFGKIKSRTFYVEVNQIETVDLNAFRASKDYLSLLSLFGNKIVDFPFSDLKDFTALSTLNMGRNLIHTIPDNAFQSRSLWAIVLAQNQIRNIGKNAFANLPSLGRLELSYNQIKTLGPYALASKQHGSGLQLSLSANKIEDIDDTAFDGVNPYAVFVSQNQLKTLKKSVFQPLVTKAAQQGGFIEVSYNPLTCKGCDYTWITLNKDVLAQKLIGFTCRDGTSIHDLTKSKIGCN